MERSAVSRFFVKFLEVAGAGLASAVCAYGLGQIGKPVPGAPAASVSSPAAEDAIRLAHDDHALLVELVRKGAEAQRKPESVAPTAAKPAKQTSAAPPRRNQKQDPARLAESKSRPVEAKPTQSPAPILDPAPRVSAPGASAQPASGQNGSAPTAPAQGADAGPARDAPAGSANEEDRPLFAKLKLVPSWLSPGSRSDVPRPPMPVGDFTGSAM